VTTGADLDDERGGNRRRQQILATDTESKTVPKQEILAMDTGESKTMPAPADPRHGRRRGSARGQQRRPEREPATMPGRTGGGSQKQRTRIGSDTMLGIDKLYFIGAKGHIYSTCTGVQICRKTP
jgi:hypothetical protein